MLETGNLPNGLPTAQQAVDPPPQPILVDGSPADDDAAAEPEPVTAPSRRGVCSVH